MVNMSLINELRAAEIKVRIEMKNIEDERVRINNRGWAQEDYSRLLTAQANLLNGLAHLVAAQKR